MKNDWMIHVLKDLRTFAEMNGLDDLAGKLVETLEVALPAVAGLEASDEARLTSYAGTSGNLGRASRGDH
ncbi:hypothetical protein [Palleronia abyssalis]|uniref:Uncharacterized protein n=1 Tax=Palleronia abyssalis TaxID=1501240 RepID=A0A2R8C1J1_9RHOB|nr:hypothetical protein [Palleronia abyssalis]SPJ26260.1 hypothetical protein PAA8504_04117 [Palleronia abyssalis]